MDAPNCWIAAIAQHDALAGVAGGYAEVAYGKAGPLERMRAGDGFAVYSPRVTWPNGALLQAGLVDEMSVVIAPYLAASATAHPAYLAAGLGRPGTVTLEPAAVERLRQWHVWLRYTLHGSPFPG